MSVCVCVFDVYEYAPEILEARQVDFSSQQTPGIYLCGTEITTTMPGFVKVLTVEFGHSELTPGN